MGIFSVLIRLYENTFENASDRILRTQLYVYVIVMQKKNYRKFSVAVLKDSMEGSYVNFKDWRVKRKSFTCGPAGPNGPTRPGSPKGPLIYV